MVFLVSFFRRTDFAQTVVSSRRDGGRVEGFGDSIPGYGTMTRLFARWIPTGLLGIALLLLGILADDCQASGLTHHKKSYTKTKTVTKVYHNTPVPIPAVPQAPVAPVSYVPMAPMSYAPVAPTTYYAPVYAMPTHYVPMAPAYMPMAPAAYVPMAPAAYVPAVPSAPMAPSAPVAPSGQR